MQLSRFIEALQEDLASSDPETAQVAQRLGFALRGVVGLRMLEAVSELAIELSAQLPNGHIEVRLAGQDPHLVFVEEEQAQADHSGDDELSARITLRLSEGLKAAVEAGAARDGISVNTWIVRELSKVVHRPGRSPRIGNRLTGYGRS
jgi:predicted DNA binding CopG/RHH family protein